MSDAHDIAELYAQVYAHPDDDHVRQVLADALISIGDPRGQLILMQLQPAADQLREVMGLLQRHGLSWLGRLRDVVVPLAYERGFLASCLVVTDVRPVIAVDEWATVHTIELPVARFLDFALHPVMRALKRLVNPAPELLVNLAARHGEQLAQLAIEMPFSPALPDVLSRYLPPNAIRALTVHGVPAQARATLARAAARHTGVALVGPAFEDRYDDTDE
ncbi:MAG TPA: hypothetical protein VFQ53_11120 [Kofleriaceae bacterium]|nr:hypothetical protein [Kofleriaceae bacterium]